MSSLINLATATLLAVSPVLSEPKQVERPENVLYEKVEYLDNNITATSFIYYSGDDKSFQINFSDNKLIDLSYFWTLEESYLFFDSLSYVSNLQNVGFELDISDIDFTNISEAVLNYNYLFTCNFDISNDTLDYSFPYLGIVDNGLIVQNELVSADVENGDLQEYYSNITNVINYNLNNNNLFNIFLKRYVLKVEGPGIIDNTFGIVGNTIQEYVSVVVDLFSQVVALFYAQGKLTILGVLMVFAFGIGVVKFGFNMMKTLLRL